MTESRARPRTPAGAPGHTRAKPVGRARRFRVGFADGPTRSAIGFGVLVVVAGAAALFAGPLTRREHRVDATPSPPPLAQLALVRLPGGASACLSHVVVDGGSQVARFRVGTFGRPGPRLTVAAAGRRYDVPAGFADNAEVAVALRPPRRTLVTRVCITDRGRRPVALYGSDELRTRSRVAVTVDGRPVRPDVTLELDRARARSVLGELSAVVERATRWRPGVAPWLVWALLVAVLVGIPGGALYALGRSLAEDAAQPGGERVAARVGDDVAR